MNEETGEILRHPKTNRVIACKPNEAGELIGKIIAGNPLRDFQGYKISTTEITSLQKIILFKM